MMTFYFLPLVPIGPCEWILQCQDCRQNWDPSILRVHRVGIGNLAANMLPEENFQEELLRAMVLMVIDRGRIAEDDIQGLMRIGSGLMGRVVHRDELGWICSSAYQNKIPIENYLHSMIGNWTEDQQQVALHYLFLTATIGEDLTDHAAKVLAKYQKMIGLSETEFQEIVEAAVQFDETRES